MHAYVDFWLDQIPAERPPEHVPSNKHRVEIKQLCVDEAGVVQFTILP